MVPGDPVDTPPGGTDSWPIDDPPPAAAKIGAARFRRRPLPD
jgi:hypothetical protein